jgi:hypothetical protein
MSEHRALTAEQQKLNDLWDVHLRAEFRAHGAGEGSGEWLADSLVNNVPVMTGGSGRESRTNLTPNISCQNTKGQMAMFSPTDSVLKRERDRTSALVAGLAATVAAWTVVAAFAPETVGLPSCYSPWFCGPAAIAAWALFSTIAYRLVAHGRDRRTPLDLHESYRCPELAISPKSNGHSLCANQNEKICLGAVTASFALTITAWVGALSLMPENWIDSLGKSPAWICCVASMVLWSILSAAMYLVFRAPVRNPVNCMEGSARSYHSSIRSSSQYHGRSARADRLPAYCEKSLLRSFANVASSR